MLGVTYEIAEKLFSYDESTGDIRWKYRDLDDPFICNLFVNKAIKAFNTRSAGKLAGSKHPVSGHLHVRHMLFGKDVTSTNHHIAWLLKTGFPPPMGYDIDHKDQNPTNNSWHNLRLVHRTVNVANSKVRKDNTSGVKGVRWVKKENKWVVNFNISGKQSEVYRSQDFFEAVCVRKSLEYKNNFGEANSTSKVIEKVEYINTLGKTEVITGISAFKNRFRVYQYDENRKQINLGTTYDWFDAVCRVKSYLHKRDTGVMHDTVDFRVEKE